MQGIVGWLFFINHRDDEGGQFLHGDAAGAVLVSSLEKDFDVGGGAKESDEFLLAESAIGIGIKLGVPLRRSLAGDPEPLDAFEFSREFLLIESA